MESINFRVHLLSFCETTMKILHLKNVVRNTFSLLPHHTLPLTFPHNTIKK